MRNQICETGNKSESKKWPTLVMVDYIVDNSASNPSKAIAATIAIVNGNSFFPDEGGPGTGLGLGLGEEPVHLFSKQ